MSIEGNTVGIDHVWDRKVDTKMLLDVRYQLVPVVPREELLRHWPAGADDCNFA